jgi:hypothetical protein
MAIFPIEITFFEDLFFLPFFASACERDADFDEIAFCVYLDGDDGGSHFLDFLVEPKYFFFAQEERAFAFRVEDFSCIIPVFRYMATHEYGNAGMHRDV